MIDSSVRFKINSETDMDTLKLVYNTVLRRIQALEAIRVVQKAEVVCPKKEEVSVLEIK